MQLPPIPNFRIQKEHSFVNYLLISDIFPLFFIMQIVKYSSQYSGIRLALRRYAPFVIEIHLPIVHIFLYNPNFSL